jgi:hypothetical protein
MTDRSAAGADIRDEQVGAAADDVVVELGQCPDEALHQVCASRLLERADRHLGEPGRLTAGSAPFAGRTMRAGAQRDRCLKSASARQHDLSPSSAVLDQCARRRPTINVQLRIPNCGSGKVSKGRYIR